MVKLATAITVVILAVIGQHVCRFILALNPFRIVYNHWPGPCHLVPGVTNGSEDLTVTSSGLVFISSGPNDNIGKLFTLDMNSPNVHVSKVSIQPTYFQDDFIPFGLSVFEDPTSKEIRLFAINFNGFTIETFRYDPPTNTAHHIKSIKHPLITSPNDIVATGPDSFYVSNMSPFSSFPLMALSLLAFLPTGSVVYYENGDAKTVANGIKFANGINMSPDGQVIYVASMFMRAIKVYRRQSDNSLEFDHDIMVYSNVDNINVEPTTGDLWVGTHPRMWQAIVGPKPLGSQVLQIKHAESRNPVVTSIYSNDGQELSASSAAVYHNGHLLVGSVFSELLYCKVDIPT